MNNNKGNYIYVCIFAVAFAMLFWWWVYTSQSSIALDLISSNVKVYVIGILIFASFLLILGSVTYYFIIKGVIQNRRRNIKLNTKLQIITCIIMIMIGVAIFIEWGLYSQHLEVGEENAAYSYFPLLIRGSITAALLILIGIYIIRKYDMNNVVLWTIYFIALLVSFMSVYVVNPYADWGSLNNTVTITETIYNVADMVPYTWETTPLYGHYGLFFLLPLKIIGTNVVTIGVLLAIGELIEEIVFIYVINACRAKNWIKALVVMASIVRPTYRYPAITPIRTLWPVLICGLLVFIHNKGIIKRTSWIILSFILAGCAILQNTETGIGCLIGVLAYYIWMDVYFYKMETKNLKILCTKILNRLILFIMGFLFPIVVVNIYNFCCGINVITFRCFFYPFIGSDWATNELRCNVPIGNHAWVYIIIFLMVCCAIAIIELLFLDTDVKYAPTMGISMIGIVIFCYYFNEAHWGCMDIIKKVCAMLMMIVITDYYVCLENSADDVLSQIKRSVVIIALIIFANYSISSVLSDPIRISQMYKSGIYDGNVVKEEAENILKERLPENIYGVGQGISTIYHELGWDNYAHYRDTSALNISDRYDGYDELVREILTHDEFLIGFKWYDTDIIGRILQEDSSYIRKSVFTFLDYEYAYYSKK